MAYFPDFTPYAYGDPEPGVVHIGWLTKGYDYPKGPVSPWILKKLARLVSTGPLHGIYMGSHQCELCPKDTPIIPRSNGEIRVSFCGVTYAAPYIIGHYIEAHGYCPPPQFIAAVGKAETPTG